MLNELEAFYGGAAGGGKTDALLMAALQYVDQPNYNAILFRRSYTDLALPGALMAKSHEWLRSTAAHWDRERHTWTFPSGATMGFGYIGNDQDRWRYQSAEYQFVGWDEITEWPDDESYLFLFSRLRKLEGSKIPLRVRSASNPVGIGAHWVRERFIENATFTDTKGKTQQRIFIPAKYNDNPFIDQDAYLQSLQNLHPALQRRLIDGSWDEVEDTSFPEFSEEIHVIPHFKVSQGWRVWESMDFGVSNPTAWYSAATDGEFTVVQGEYYEPGLVSHHSSRILTLRENRWGHPSITLCDPSIRARTGFGESGRGDTVHSEFAKNGIALVPANNDRIEGRIRISELLKTDPLRPYPDWHPKKGELGAPRLFFVESCKNLIKQVKFAPLDHVTNEVVDPYWEQKHGHAVASLRYLLAARVVVRPSQAQQLIHGDRTLGEWRPWEGWSEY